MSKKYVITNCPAFAKGIFCKGGDIIDDRCADKTLDRNTLISCQDCTDCLLKRIVKITKNYTKGYGKHCDINRKENNCGKTCNAYKIRQILDY